MEEIGNNTNSAQQLSLCWDCAGLSLAITKDDSREETDINEYPIEECGASEKCDDQMQSIEGMNGGE